MFTLSHVLSSDHQRAQTVWAKGAPKAKNISQARTAWRPHLDTWAKYMESDFAAAMGVHRAASEGPKRVGWIDDADFWRSFWRGFEQARGRSTPVELNALTPCIEGAAVAGSVAFFASMPTQYIGEMHRVLLNTEAMMDPAVFAWIQTNVPPRDSSFLAWQYDRWTWMEWRHEPKSLLLKGRGEATKQELIDLVGRAIAAGMVQLDREKHLVGHLMAHRSAWATPDTIVRLGQVLPNMKECLPLLALCSGMDVDGSPRGKAIAQLGKRVTMGGSMGALDGAGGTDADLFAVIHALADVQTPIDLYHAVLALGFYHSGVEALPMAVDGALFSQGLLCQSAVG